LRNNYPQLPPSNVGGIPCARMAEVNTDPVRISLVAEHGQPRFEMSFTEHASPPPFALRSWRSFNVFERTRTLNENSSGFPHWERAIPRRVSPGDTNPTSKCALRCARRDTAKSNALVALLFHGIWNCIDTDDHH